MKLCKKSQLLKQGLYSIAYINNLDSKDLRESIKMIVKKDLELELLIEFNFYIGIDEMLKMLDRVSLYNHLQRRYEIIVSSELVECEK